MEASVQCHGARILCTGGGRMLPGIESVRPRAARSGRGTGCRLSIRMDLPRAFDGRVSSRKKMDPIQEHKQRALKIGIVGFGNFGQFLAARFVKHGHHVLAHSRSDYSGVCEELGVSFFRCVDDFCEEHPDIVLLSTSILSTEAVLRSLPLERLRRSTLFVDVLSVKEFPRSLFQQILPGEFDVLCTHPMFGPESGKGSWDALPLVYEKVRIGSGARNEERCQAFLEIFEQEGCRMVEMSCDEHDRFAASSQFITHTVGRMLGKLELESTPINTKGYETLLDLVQNTGGDSFDLYYGLFMYNKNATEELQRLELAFDALKKQLFGKLHNILRKQLFEVGTAAAGNALVAASASATIAAEAAPELVVSPVVVSELNPPSSE